MRLLRHLLATFALLYSACWFTTVPEIHRRQTGGVIDTVLPNDARPIRGDGLQYGTLASRAYAIVPFYYYGQVSRRFGEQDGYPEMRHYVGVGSFLLAFDADLHAETP